jgi:oxalate decarboxylase/phosphoglucose isomerase-like protein (cupin superfamily)
MVLILFNSPEYQEINMSTWLAANPDGFLSDNFGISKELVDKLPKEAIGIAAPPGRLILIQLTRRTQIGQLVQPAGY